MKEWSELSCNQSSVTNPAKFPVQILRDRKGGIKEKKDTHTNMAETFKKPVTVLVKSFFFHLKKMERQRLFRVPILS
jgi:hypothetical protein